MKKILTLAASVAAAALAVGSATSAQAALTLRATNLNCNVYGTFGCVFDIGSGDGSAVFDNPLAFETAYNAQHVEGPLPATIDIGDFLDKSPNLSSTSYAVNLPSNFLVNFYSVKAGTSTILFGLTTPTNIFTAVNNGIKNPPGTQFKNISHVTFYGTFADAAVPEPATWAMMIMGFGGVGALLRQRRRVFG